MKMRRFICMLASVVISLAIVGSGAAFAASPGSQAGAQTKAQWQQAIAKLRTPANGCYHASYPSLQWHATRCLVAPNMPLAPRLQTRSGGPLVVGDGADYSAQEPGTIFQATGTFDDVSSKITEKGQIGGEGPQVKNAFTLQLNSEFFSTPVCSGSADPSECEGWQQFIYAYHYGGGDTNLVFMQYWLLFWNTTCPAGWNTDDSGSDVFCYKNSAGTSYGALPAKDLGKIKLVASASSGGSDQVTLSNTSGEASTASGSDSVLDLASVWNTTEWDVFGDAGGAEANFGADSTLEPVTTFRDSETGAPKCVKEGFTAETNNLTRTKTPALGPETSPTMASTQTNGTTQKMSCAVKA